VRYNFWIYLLDQIFTHWGKNEPKVLIFMLLADLWSMIHVILHKSSLFCTYSRHVLVKQQQKYIVFSNWSKEDLKNESNNWVFEYIQIKYQINYSASNKHQTKYQIKYFDVSEMIAPIKFKCYDSKLWTGLIWCDLLISFKVSHIGLAIPEITLVTGTAQARPSVGSPLTRVDIFPRKCLVI
jgi:hypothetical protein